MQTLETTVANDDVLRWLWLIERVAGSRTVLPTIVVATSLYGYIVISVIEVYLLDQQITRHLGVNAIIVHQFRIITQTATDYILALEKMYAPEWRICDETKIKEKK